MLGEWDSDKEGAKLEDQQTVKLGSLIRSCQVWMAVRRIAEKREVGAVRVEPLLDRCLSGSEVGASPER